MMEKIEKKEVPLTQAEWLGLTFGAVNAGMQMESLLEARTDAPRAVRMAMNEVAMAVLQMLNFQLDLFLEQEKQKNETPEPEQG